MLALFLVALSVGLSNLAAAIGLGTGGVTAATRVRVGIVFGVLEAGMPIIGLLLGHGLATDIGRQAKWLAAALLIIVGCYGIVAARRSARTAAAEGAGHAAGSDRPLVSSGAQRHTSAAAERWSAGQAAGSAPEGTSVADQRGPNLGRLIITGVALSLDNLVAGFALGAYNVHLWAGALVFGTVSVVLSLVGLEFGARIGARAGQYGELIGGVVLVIVGIAIGAGALG